MSIRWGSAAAIPTDCCSGSGGRAFHCHLLNFNGRAGESGCSWRCDAMSFKNKNFSPKNSRPGGLTRTSRTGGFSRFGSSERAGRIKAVTSATPFPPVAANEEGTLQQCKYELLRLANETARGLTASADQRADIEEAMVAVEKFDAGKPLQLDGLDGTWLLQYTTAPDVVGILQAAQTPFIKVGQIFQKFECRGRVDGGSVKNVVRWSIPSILQEDGGATLVVDASFSVVSPRSIALRFEEAKLGDILISEELQGFIAPAILPRSFFVLQILQFLRSLNIRVPLVRPALPGAETSNRIPIGLRYYLTFLDHDMLVGRALGNGGIFIFSRTQRLELF